MCAWVLNDTIQIYYATMDSIDEAPDNSVGGGDGDVGSGNSVCEDNVYALGISFGASCLLLLLEQWLGSSSCDSSSISQLLWHSASRLQGKTNVSPPVEAQDV